MRWFIAGLRKYAVFDGRASRAEYWWFFLYVLIVTAIFSVPAVLLLGEGIGTEVVGGLCGVAIALPFIGVTVRRLHDTDRSIRYVFISLVPLVGPFVLLVFLAQKGTPGENKYGPNPKDGSAPARVETHSSTGRRYLWRSNFEGLVKEMLGPKLSERFYSQSEAVVLGYAPCPRCLSEHAQRVGWTRWGGSYGPKLLTRVQCLDCGAKYNGKTGKSNMLMVILFAVVSFAIAALAVFVVAYYVWS
jgi:uncharacterized membrane protein YhaH (DUF805 family)